MYSEFEHEIIANGQRIAREKDLNLRLLYGLGAIGVKELPRHELIERIIDGRPKIDPIATVNDLTSRMSFEERHRGLILGHDPIGLERRLPSGLIERYEERYRKEHDEGKVEASWGAGEIGGQRVAIFTLNWEFMGGSLGSVAGEKFQRAADFAQAEKLPLVALFSSGGARQQENALGLAAGMEKMSNAVRNFKESGHRSYIAVLVGEVWGGISASPVPIADVTVALAGSNYGFSGPRVISAFEGIATLPEGAQTAENNLLDRNIDLIVEDSDELMEWLEQYLRTTAKPQKELNAETFPRLRFVGDKSRTVKFGGNGIAPALLSRQDEKTTLEVPVGPYRASEENIANELDKRYQDSIRSAELLDAEFVINNIFSGVVPLYNHYVDIDRKIYPAIIAAIGKIGPQPFGIIANQSSFLVQRSTLRRIPATPAPKDFEYARRMLQRFDHLDLPVVFLTDTLGAEPSVKAEAEGQGRAIAEMIYDANAYRRPVLSVVLNALGSGGGLATTPRGDWRAMMERSMAYVAEPRSAASILVKEPDQDDTRRTLSTMSATAQDQLRLGLIDEIITESDDPYKTMGYIHSAIAKAFVERNKRGLHFRRNRRVRSMGQASLKESRGDD